VVATSTRHYGQRPPCLPHKRSSTSRRPRSGPAGPAANSARNLDPEIHLYWLPLCKGPLSNNAPWFAALSQTFRQRTGTKPRSRNSQQLSQVVDCMYLFSPPVTSSETTFTPVIKRGRGRPPSLRSVNPPLKRWSQALTDVLPYSRYQLSNWSVSST
jgi:hypothetical protein